MKIIYILKMFILAALITNTSCENGAVLNEEPIDLKAEFQDKAMLHNEAMDFVFSKLKSQPIYDADIIMKEVIELSGTFIHENQSRFERLEDANKQLLDESNRLVSFRKSDLLKSTYSDSDYLIYTIDLLNEYLNESQKNLLYRINDILSSSLPFDAIMKEIAYITDIECQKLPVQDRKVIYAATSIGVESIKYWNENLDDWVEVLSDSNLKSVELVFDWRALGKSDISGAIGGAIGGAIVGAVAGGVGALPGAASGFVGGGIGASVADAVTQVLDR